MYGHRVEKKGDLVSSRKFSVHSLFLELVELFHEVFTRLHEHHFR